MLIGIVVLVVAVVGGGAIAVRSAGHDVDRWHVDPLTAPSPSTPNSYRVGPDASTVPVDAPAPVYDVTPEELSAAFDRLIAAEARTELLADDRGSGGAVTVVQRSALFGFPDYVSVRFLPVAEGDGSTVAMFSRSRFGQSDLGVNEKRVNRWLEELRGLVS